VGAVVVVVGVVVVVVLGVVVVVIVVVVVVATPEPLYALSVFGSFSPPNAVVVKR